MPQISVIIPMYNVEKYVGECLESLLLQTFQDFEAIVVDDCSTDKSLEVVKNFLPKFDGRLKLIESEINSGGCAVPRNIGLTYARGKYLFFLDSDDLIIKTAFAELFDLAEKFNADVVQCEKFYTSENPKLQGASLTLKTFLQSGLIEKPTLETSNIARRIKKFHDKKYVWTAWSKFIRRDFMLENKIEYPAIKNIEDLIFTIYCLSCAKNFLLVPNIVNIYRYRPDSILHTKPSIKNYVRKWINSFVTGFECLDDFLQNLKFYQENPDIKYLALDAVAQDIFRYLSKIYQKFHPAILEDIILEEFQKSAKAPKMAAFFFNLSALYSLQFKKK